MHSILKLWRSIFLCRKNDSPWVHGLWVSIKCQSCWLTCPKVGEVIHTIWFNEQLTLPTGMELPEWMDASGYLGMNKAVANPGNTDLYTYKYVTGWCIMVKFHLEFWSVCTMYPWIYLENRFWPTGKSFANSSGWTSATIMLVIVHDCSDRSAIALGDKSLCFGTSFSKLKYKIWTYTLRSCPSVSTMARRWFDYLFSRGSLQI